MFHYESFISIKEYALLVWQRVLDILHAPFQTKEMLFMLLPLLFVLLIIELYFGKYRDEKLGWNTAVGNSLTLFFVSMNLLNFLYTNNTLFEEHSKTALSFIVMTESLFLFFVDFFHIFPKEVAFGISSPLILNYVGAASVIMVYSSIPFSTLTLFAFVVLFIAIFLLIKLLQMLEFPFASKESHE